MTTHVERSIEVDVPVSTAYDQWTQFEDFPRFMGGVQQVRQVGDTLTHWVAEIAGVRREWDAEIVEQVPDRKVAWAATTGTTNAGAVFFDAVSAGRTRVRLTLDYEPEGIVERIGDVLDVVDRQAVADLDRFKEYIENRGATAGGRPGAVHVGAGAGVAGVPDDTTPGAGTARMDGGTAAAAGAQAEAGRTGTAAGATSPAGVTDPVGEDRTTWTDGPWAPGGSGPGEDRGIRDTSGEGEVRRNYANETITTRDVVARDFDDRDVSGEGTIARDFANRDITERDIANRGIVPGSTHEAPQPHGSDAPGPADGVGAGVEPPDPRSGVTDDPNDPRPSA